MLDKPEPICSGCPLFRKGKGFVPDQVVPEPTYTLYGEAPGKIEIVVGKPFQGKAGFVLKNWILRAVPKAQLALERNKITFRNVLRCLPPELRGRAYPTGEEKIQAETCCSQHAQGEDGETIVLFGESPQRFFFGKELEAEDLVDHKLGHQVKGVLGRVGRVYERDGRRYVFAPHPAFVLRQPALVTHGQAALRIAVQESKELTIDYMNWEAAIAEQRMEKA